MKILNKQQIQQADGYTIENEPIASIDLMERASTEFVNSFTKKFRTAHRVVVFAGKGNNGGDGLAISRLLLEWDYEVVTYVVNFTQKVSEDFQENRNHLTQMPKASVVDLWGIQDLPEIKDTDVVIDAVLGSGLSRPIEGFTRELVFKINNSLAYTVAVDIPSGLFCDAYNADEAIIQADYTLTFQMPKYAFLMPESQHYTGKFEVLDIGLSAEFLELAETFNFFINEGSVLPLLKLRNKFDHKGTFGHALIIAGSYGKIGAAKMAANACLSSGAGLVSAYVPACGYAPLQTSLPEVMVMTDQDQTIWSEPPEAQMFDVYGIGPGLGREAFTLDAFRKLLESQPKPCVIDADGINMMADEPALQGKIPPYSILTPHPGEFARLAGKASNGYERVEQLRAMSHKLNSVIVLKGGHSAVGLPNGEVHFNSTGNPGMATGGSGDVLTGLLTGLLSQGYEADQAAILGTYVHGLAGDQAACKKGFEGLIASDIIEHLPEAFKQLHLKRSPLKL